MTSLNLMLATRSREDYTKSREKLSLLQFVLIISDREKAAAAELMMTQDEIIKKTTSNDCAVASEQLNRKQHFRRNN